MISSPNGLPSPKKQQIFFISLLCLLALASYFQVLSSDFIESYDDEMYLTQNHAVSNGFTLEALRWSLTSFYTGNWHPLTWWSHLIDITLFGMNPVGHHSVNLIIHTINTVLIYAFFFRVTRLCSRSFLVAALFSIHPLHVESVAWVAERKDVLSSLLALAALHAYVTYTKTEKKIHYLAMAALFCLSLAAKPMMVTFPFLLLIIDYWPLERTQNLPVYQLFREKMPLMIPVAAISIISIIAQKSVGALVPLDNDSVLTRICNILDAYTVYLRKFFVPYDLASFYPYRAVSGESAFVAFILLAIISGAVWRYRRDKPWLPGGWLWFLVTLLPVIGIVRIGDQAYADRYTYIPIIGLIVMVVWGVPCLFRKNNQNRLGFYAISVMAIIICGVLTSKQSGYWKDSVSLYSRDVAVTKENWHAHFGLANALAKRQNFNEALDHYYAALAIRPRSADTHNNLGATLRRMGRNQEAITHLLQAVEINPGYLTAHFNLALTSAELGNREAARQSLQTALSIDPGFQEARRYLEELESGQ